MNSSIDITQIVNASILQYFPDAFYKATGFACGIHSLSGDLITAIPRNNNCLFCQNMFYDSKGHERCLQSNNMGDAKAYSLKKPYIYQCHSGLTDISAPIIIRNEHIGSITFGQLIIDKRDDELRNRVRENLKGFPPDFIEKQMEYLEQVQVVPRKRVEGLTQLLSLIANNIILLLINNLEERAQNIESAKKIDELQAAWNLENRIRQAQIQLKEMELKVLQGQINPHFLYNTLDTIKWLAVLRGEDDIQHIVVALGDLLRYSLDQGNDFVPVSKELENIESYLLIQNYRYGEKISYSIPVDSAVLNLRIPKLIMQPLVENAIKHGLEPKVTKGNLFISGQIEENGDGVIEITDDGVGMNPDEYEKVCALLTNTNNQKFEPFNNNEHRSIGIDNVNKRLLFTYGDGYGLQLSSEKGKGTTIRFKIKQDI